MKIKEKPEDFVVKEKLELPIGEGPYAYYLLKKKQWNTMDAVEEIAHRLHIPGKKIGYAGLKDRQAVTEQYISIENGKKEFDNLLIKDIGLKYLGQGSKRVNTGMLKGNEFEITVRDVEGEAISISAMPNYFDEQRFGKGNTNAEVGKALALRDFRKACEILQLDAEGNNYAGALQQAGKIVNLCLHSYQSKLFNRILSAYIKKKYNYKELSCGYDKLAFPTEDVKDDVKIPLISFDAEPEESVSEITEEVLRSEGISTRDFVIRQLPELVSQTEYRPGFAKISKLHISEITKNSQKLTFELQKGSYATVAIKALFLQNL